MDTRERELDLRQLAILVMMQWRIIAYVVLICMILGLLSVMNRTRINGVKNDTNDISEEIGYNSEEVYKYKLSLYKKMKIYYESEINKYLKQAENEKVYIENSLRMKIDPLNQVVGTANVLISSTSELSDPVASCQEKIGSDAFWAPLSEKYSIEPKYFREMSSIMLSPRSSGTRQVVQLTTSMPDKKMTEETLALLVGAFDQKGMQLLQRSVDVRVDPNLAQFQHDTYFQLAQLYKELHDMYNSYAGLAKPLKKAPSGTHKPGSGLGKRALLKGAVFGGLAGACGAAMLIALSLILSGRLLSYSELFDKYPLTCLTVFPSGPTRRHTRALDRQLLKWRDSSRFNRLDRTERFDIAVEKIRMHVKGGESILLLGTIALPRIQEVQVALAERLVSYTVGTWHFVDQQLATLHEIDQYEHIILVEEVGISKFQDIDNEIQALLERSKKIVGCIVM